MKVSFSKILSTCTLMLALLCSCTTISNSPYRDPTEMRGGGTKFSSYDFQQSVVAMVDSLLSNTTLEHKLRTQFGDAIPVVAVMPIANRTHDFLELHTMSQTIESKLVNSGRFDFVDRQAEQLFINEMSHDAENVLTSDAGVTDFGLHVRADYLLTGELNEIRDAYGDTRESYYKLTMKLQNKHTGKIDWSGEKEIRKVTVRPTFGW